MKLVSYYFAVAAAAVLLLLSEPCSSASQPFGITTAKTSGFHHHPQRSLKQQSSSSSSWEAIPRGGSESSHAASAAADAGDSPGEMVVSAVKGLSSYMAGPKADTLLLLLTTALNTPFCKMLGTSPILGFLVLGVLFGPNGFSLIKDIHTTECT
jgi:hypothetical protein